MRERIESITLYFGTLAVCCVVALGVACVPPGPTELPDITVQGGDQTVIVGGGTGATPGASPAPNGPCNPVASLGVALLGTGGLRTAEVRVGQSVTLDTTPRDSNNQIRPDSCNVATPVLWRLNPTAGICSLNNETSYTPTLTGIGVGKCEAFSQINGITAQTPVVVTVRQ